MSNAGPEVAGDPFSQSSSEFLHWLRAQNGVRVSQKIKIDDLRSRGAGRGVVAVTDIPNDEELFAIPDGTLLSFKNSDLKEKPGFGDKEKELGPWMALMLTMIYEYLKGGSSQWLPYYNVLPSSFDTLMFWSEDELRELQGSAIVSRIGKQEANESMLTQLLPLVTGNPDLFPTPNGLQSFDSPEGKEHFLSIAHRMGSLIMAYAFDVEKDDDEDEGEDGYVTDEEELVGKAMVPLADMLNADADRNNARLFQDAGYFIMRTVKPVKAGEELFNDYGEIPRSDLLRRYGYVTDNYAKYDVVDMPRNMIFEEFGISPANVENDPRTSYLDDIEILDDGYSIPRLPEDTPLSEALPEELIILLHVLTLPLDKVSMMHKKGKVPKPSFGQAEAQPLLRAVRRRLSDYPSTIDQDNQLLASLAQNPSPTNRRKQMAIEVRKGEKEVLIQVAAALEAFLNESEGANGKRAADPMDIDSKRQRV